MLRCRYVKMWIRRNAVKTATFYIMNIDQFSRKAGLIQRANNPNGRETPSIFICKRGIHFDCDTFYDNAIFIHNKPLCDGMAH